MHKGKRSSRRSLILAGACGFILAAAPASLPAADRTWLIPFTNTFSVTGNWSSALVPGINDNAIFDKAGIYTVNFTNAPTNVDLTVTNGTLTFSRTSGSGAYTLTGQALVNSNAQLTLNNGMDLVADDLD